MTLAIAVSLGLFAGIASFAAAAGLVGSWPAALAIAALVAAASGFAAWKRPPIALDEGACPRGLRWLAGLATVATLVQLGRLAVFMVAPAQAGFSTIPASEFELRHSCLTAYYVAAAAADETPNVYDDALYSLPGDASARRKPKTMGPFNVDVFEYPPPFLLLPRLLLWFLPDFDQYRAFWFGLNLAVIGAGLLVAARSMGGPAATRALLLAPLVFVALPTLSTLQKGNVQAIVIVLSVLAMLCFDRGRPAAGGALLAYAIVSKLYPGMLVVPLLVNRQWRAVAWTAAFGLAYLVLTLVDLGVAPFVAFFHHLPGLLSGEAFPAFRNPAATAINYSIPGLVFKAKLFGVPGMGFGAAKVVGWLYTAVALWATVALTRRMRAPEDRPLVYLAILILATLRSPFLPQAYAAFPPLWLLTLLAAVALPTTRTLSWTVAGWLALNVFWPHDWPMDPRHLALVSAVPQAVTIAIAVLVLRRGPSPAASGGGQ